MRMPGELISVNSDEKEALWSAMALNSLAKRPFGL